MFNETARRLGAGLLMAALTLGTLRLYAHAFPLQEVPPVSSVQETTVPSPATDAAETTGTTETTQGTEATLLPLPEPPQTSAEGILVLELSSGRELYAKNPLERLYPASVTKLMTALTALEYGGEGLIYTVGEEIGLIQPHSTTARLKRGQKLDFTMLLAAMLLPSGNDAAYVMAASVGRHVAGDPALSAMEAVEVFVERMNHMARELDLDRTVFRNPDGYHDPLHYTTARDLAVLAEKVLQYPEIRRTVELADASFTLLSGETVTWHNTNQLIRRDGKQYYEGCYGVKTGTTLEAGACLVAAARRGDTDLLVIVLRCADNSARWADAAALLDYGFTLSGLLEGT